MAVPPGASETKKVYVLYDNIKHKNLVPEILAYARLSFDSCSRSRRLQVVGRVTSFYVHFTGVAFVAVRGVKARAAGRAGSYATATYASVQDMLLIPPPPFSSHSAPRHHSLRLSERKGAHRIRQEHRTKTGKKDNGDEKAIVCAG